MKASVHHDSQSNGGVGNGKGSETVCFLGVQSDPRGFLTASSSEFDSDRRLFRKRGGEGEGSLAVGTVGGECKFEGLGVGSGEGGLNSAKCYSVSYKVEIPLTNDVFEAGVT